MIELHNQTLDAVPLPGPGRITLLAGQRLQVNPNVVDLRRVRRMTGIGIRDLERGQPRAVVVESASEPGHFDSDPESTSEPESEPDTSPEPEPIDTSDPEPNPEPNPEPAPAPEPEAVPEVVSSDKRKRR